MKFELSESELKRNLDWLKKENGSLNDYGTVIRYLLNEIEELKKRQETRPHETFVMGLKGEVVKIGEMYVDDELLTGMFIDISRDEFLEQDTNYLYQKVKVVKEEAP